MSFTQAVSAFYSNFADVKTRTTRSGFWWVVLYIVAVYIVLGIIAAASPTFSTVLIVLWWVVHIIPSITLAVRRLHDTGKSGWWLLIGLIPFGGIVLLIFYLLPSDRGPNEWG